MHLIKTSIAVTLFAVSTLVSADTTDVAWQSVVAIEKQGAHCVGDPNCFNRYHPAIPTVVRANPGDRIVFHTRDALDPI